MPDAFKSSVTKTGVFFTVDPGKKFHENMKAFVDALAREGEADVRGQLQAGEGSRFPLGGGIKPGRVSGHVVGRTKSRTGKQWAATAVVSVNNSGLSPKQGIKLMAAASWLESQHHAFRRTKARLKRARAVNSVDLLKGIR